MTEENNNDGEGVGGAADLPTKRAKSLTVRVLRAVDRYHHRNTVLTVPNDEYHRGLVAQGNLRLEED